MPSLQNTHIFDGHFKLDTFGFPAESLERAVELGVDDFADLTLLHREPLLLKLHVELDSITFLQAIFLRILLILQIHLRLDLMDLGQGKTKTPNSQQDLSGLGSSAFTNPLHKANVCIWM